MTLFADLKAQWMEDPAFRAAYEALPAEMEYKGFVAGPIVFDPEDGLFTGTVTGLRDVIHFRGRNADELMASFHEGIDDYLAFCAEEGRGDGRS